MALKTDEPFGPFWEGSCFNEAANRCCNYLNNKEFFERELPRHKRIEIDCDRSFEIGKDQRGNPLYGEVVEIIPIFYT